MAQTLEKRVDVLERNLAELVALVTSMPQEKAWLGAAGTLTDDELSREADRLGREYRNSLQYPLESAGS